MPGSVSTVPGIQGFIRASITTGGEKETWFLAMRRFPWRSAAARDDRSFLWHVFTRFEPAADLHGARRIARNHVAFTPPVVVDARMKPWMPGTVEADPETVRLVDRRWREYFP